jgi:hypothetical protein
MQGGEDAGVEEFQIKDKVRWDNTNELYNFQEALKCRSVQWAALAGDVVGVV